ncbi:arylamine N-acetyltransferase [Streptomyces sp. PT12]|uniref:arylamine N-acetyltransferase family protein n=1 Tax=Streptomyces sp. PT12 TaxID=1510197 RepID=UPI000DE46612|nr:arylamine N-acetyltransferase [Streptomyces sp. PT12]RBM10953.1 acetyltransferase [Streptomyces sp. PT12]
MFSVDAYLSSLGWTGPAEPTAQTLRELHKRHMIRVAFDNSAHAKLGTSILNDIDIDLDATFDEIVIGGRGGVCFELSGLFRRLLTELGYDVIILSAGARGASGEFGPDLEHFFLGVHLDGDLWLVDVGFAGPSFIEPLRLTDEEQEQYGVTYRLIRQDGYHVLQRKGSVGDWQAVYRLKPEARTLADWNGLATATPGDDDPGWNWAGQLVASGTVIHGRSFDTGQLILVGRRFVRVDNGHEEVRVLVDTDEYRKTADHILGRDR